DLDDQKVRQSQVFSHSLGRLRPVTKLQLKSQPLHIFGQTVLTLASCNRGMMSAPGVGLNTQASVATRPSGSLW
ncbi:hypothetical protein, partial [Pseudomonas sp.]|uniref:hypothetical protein n=1 Tax=Pseudomonas sp. TaxID=306 RepID=UPI0028A69782